QSEKCRMSSENYVGIIMAKIKVSGKDRPLK
ncbi:hypothetical protein BACCAP_04206, partial [Pseudoflavonifractor capillosus ATCC 29799]